MSGTSIIAKISMSLRDKLYVLIIFSIVYNFEMYFLEPVHLSTHRKSEKKINP